MKKFLLCFIVCVSSYSLSAQIKNSSEAIAPAIAELINMYHSDYMTEEVSKVKDKKVGEVRSLFNADDTDYKKLCRLPEKSLADISKFITTSLTNAGTLAPASGDNIEFFIPASGKPKDDTLLFLFIDGQCLGIGSVNNGLFSLLSCVDENLGTLYEVTILSLTTDGKNITEVLNTNVMFKLRKSYVYIPQFKKGKISELILQ